MQTSLFSQFKPIYRAFQHSTIKPWGKEERKYNMLTLEEEDLLTTRSSLPHNGDIAHQFTFEEWLGQTELPDNFYESRMTVAYYYWEQGCSLDWAIEHYNEGSARQDRTMVQKRKRNDQRRHKY